jgi:hypothetical protein
VAAESVSGASQLSAALQRAHERLEAQGGPAVSILESVHID